jgi:CheY-like chemotaxis protein
MEGILSRRGYSATTAHGVADALARLEGMPDGPDQLITDVNVPGGRGSDLARHIRDRHDDIAVRYVSGYSKDRAVADGLIGDHSNLLDKPFNPAQLVDAAAAAPGSQRSARPHRIR